MDAPSEPRTLTGKLRGSLGWSKSRDHLCEAAAIAIEEACRLLREYTREDYHAGDQYQATQDARAFLIKHDGGK